MTNRMHLWLWYILPVLYWIGFVSCQSNNVTSTSSAKRVYIGLEVLHVVSVSDVNMDFTVDLYLNQLWNDPLRAHRLTSSQQGPVILSGSLGSAHFWQPDTFFFNQKTSRVHTTVEPSMSAVISANGDVKSTVRLTVTTYCYMEFRLFPFDTQQCELHIQSFAFDIDTVHYCWLEKDEYRGYAASVQLLMPGHAELPQFELVAPRVLKSVFNDPERGNFSRLSVDVVLERNIGSHLATIYLPTTTVTTISWLSFYIRRDQAPARIALCITTLLTMATLSGKIAGSLPQVSYLKSIDVYLALCFFFVFATLLEFCIVHYMSKRLTLNSKIRKNSAPGHSVDGQNGIELAENGAAMSAKRVSVQVRGHRCCSIRVSSIDVFSRIVFPLAFLVFNVVYFTTLNVLGRAQRAQYESLPALHVPPELDDCVQA